MSKFKPIPAKVHKPHRHERIITSVPRGYKPSMRKLNYIREAKPIPHKRTFFKSKPTPKPKAPFTYKHKTDNTLNIRFVLLMLLLMLLIAGFVLLLYYLL